jgi:HEAT repeat protein
LAWADDGGIRVAVAAADDTILLSHDRGDTWTAAAEELPVTSMVWDGTGDLFLGTDGRGIYRLAVGGPLAELSSAAPADLKSARVVDLAAIDGHLFAATPSTLFRTADSGASWTAGTPLSEGVTAIEAVDPETVYAGTQTTGIYKSYDAGRTWQPAWEGLGLAAGQMLRVTALRADLVEPGVLYAAVDYLLGSTQVHASAAGVFATVDGGGTWQPLAGPAFPEAEHASSLVLVPGKPLQARVVTDGGLQPYAPDVMRLLASLESSSAKTRVNAARQLGLVRPQGVWNELLGALDDPHMAVSLAAAEALGRINDPAATPALLIAVEHPVEEVRLGAARALGLMGVQAAVEPLRAMLLTGAGSEVSVAAQALGRIGGPAATGALLDALVDELPTARWHTAMAALETMGEPAVGPLVRMLESDNTVARQNAAQALGWIGSPTATHALARVLSGDRDLAVRGQAAWALGEIGDSSRMPLAASARRALERAQRRDPAVEVQTEAEFALSRAPSPSRAGAPQLSAPALASALALALSRAQMVRWFVLALSLAGATWLMMGSGTRLGAASQTVRRRRR